MPQEVHIFVAILSESHVASKRCGEMVKVSLEACLNIVPHVGEFTVSS